PGCTARPNARAAYSPGFIPRRFRRRESGSRCPGPTLRFPEQSRLCQGTSGSARPAGNSTAHERKPFQARGRCRWQNAQSERRNGMIGTNTKYVSGDHTLATAMGGVTNESPLLPFNNEVLTFRQKFRQFADFFAALDYNTPNLNISGATAYLINETPRIPV